MSQARLIFCVLLPFAAGYYLSYLFRTINALIASDLTAELNLSAGDLGFLTSVYFLALAVSQLPLGAMLRTIQSALLLFASVGALVFAMASDLFGLVVGRALVGLGVALALMAGFKAIVLWAPPERITLELGELARGSAVKGGILRGNQNDDSAKNACEFGLLESHRRKPDARPRLIALGVAIALMAGLKAIVWVPRRRVALANGCMVMLGAHSAVTATTPAEMLIEQLGWRGLFLPGLVMYRVGAGHFISSSPGQMLNGSKLLWRRLVSAPSTPIRTSGASRRCRR